MDDDIALTPVTASTSAVDTKSQLIDLLGIPSHLTGSGDVTLPLAYQKYKAFLVARQTLDDMVANALWPIKQPSQTELIELFVSKSFFHSHYRRHFPNVSDYPEMMAWLEGESESADVDVWGVKKVNYSFVDLKVWLENGGTLQLDDEDEEFEKHKVVKRGKGKGKEKEKGKGKEKEKGHKKESSKRAK
jgi:hypothetical protein